MGVGASITCRRQGQALLPVSHLHPEFSKDTDCKNLCSPGLLTKIKSHVPNEPRVRRQLEDQGQSERRQVEKAREKQAEKRQKGRDTQERDSQRHPGRDETIREETARDSQIETAREKTAGDRLT